MNLQWLNFASPFSPPRRSIPFVRLLTTSLHHYQKPLPPLVIPPSSSFTENFLRGSGPGGQKIVRARFPLILFPVISSCAPSNNPEKNQNKTSSAVQLQHHPTGIVVKSQATRSQSQNRKIARRLLAEKLELMEKGDESRLKIREEKVRKRNMRKRKRSRKKYGKAGEKDEKEEEEEEIIERVKGEKEKSG